MLNRPLFAVAGALVLVFVGMPVARGSSRLSEMAARQDLHDLVCIAASDGHLSGLHRAMLLEHARNILPLQEYRSFKQALKPDTAAGEVCSSLGLRNPRNRASRTPSSRCRHNEGRRQTSGACRRLGQVDRAEEAIAETCGKAE